jgi:hypothetical protein
MIPVIIAGGIAYWGYKRFIKKGMSPDRAKIYNEAMRSMADPAKLRSLADTFAKEGLTKPAEMLRKRAALREAPDSLKAARRTVFKKAMNSDNPDGILAVAKAHEDLGATGAADALRAQAEVVRAVKTA